MYKSNIKITLLVAALFFVTSCAKNPEKVLSPSIKVEVAEGAEKSWQIFFTGGLKNENASTAFINAEGNILLLNDSGDTLVSIPFKIPAVLPFETGVIKEKININEETTGKLFTALAIAQEKLGTPEEQGTRFIDEKNIKLQSFKSEKRDIVKLLEEKIK